MRNELASGAARRGEAHTENDVIQAGFEKLQKYLTGDAPASLCFLEQVAELTLKYAVGILGDLLLRELKFVVGGLAAAAPAVAVLTGLVLLAFESARVTKDRLVEGAGFFSPWGRYI